MGPLLNGLIKLQSVENRLRAVKAKLARVRRAVIIQENQVRGLQNALEAKKEEIQLTRLQSDRLELELASKDEAIVRLRGRLSAAKTNKEYAAVLTQLNTTKADNSKVENQILELMKDIEVDQANCQDLQNQIESAKGGLEQTRKEAETLAVKYEGEIKEIQDEWNQAAKTISARRPADLQVFKRLAETYDGQALAVVQPPFFLSPESRPASKTAGPKRRPNAEAYSCGGCFMGITAESVNLLATCDDIIRCPNCTRILVLGNQQD